MKILIVNVVALNGGDAAILFAICNLLSKQFGEQIEYLVYDASPEAARCYYPELTFRKSIHSRIKQNYHGKLVGSSLLERSLRWFLKNVTSFSNSFHLLRFRLAIWCENRQLIDISKLILSSEDLQDLEHFNSADLIVSTGGTYLVENYPIEAKLFDINLALSMKRPLILFTQSLGPFQGFKNQKAMRRILEEAALVLLRDEASLENLKAIKASLQSTHVSSDVAFCFADPIALESAGKKLQKKSSIKVAISVRSWSHFKQSSSEMGMKQFRDAICAATKYLVEEHQAEVIFISTCQGIPEYWTDDSKTASEIIGLLPSLPVNSVKLDREFHHPQDLIKHLQNYDLVIATRMHMAILALGAGTPVFPIAYEFKTKELFKRLGLGEWVQDIELMHPDAFVNSISNFLQVFPQIQSSIFDKVEQERQTALKSGELVRDVFQAWHQR